MKELEVEEVSKFIRSFFSEDGLDKNTNFKPCASFEVPDAIKVITASCGVRKKTINPFLTLLERGRLEENPGKLVGFVIEYARVFCHKRGLPSSGKVSIRRILRFMTIYSSTSNDRSLIIEQLLPMLTRYNIDEVRLPGS